MVSRSPRHHNLPVMISPMSKLVPTRISSSQTSKAVTLALNTGTQYQSPRTETSYPVKAILEGFGNGQARHWRNTKDLNLCLFILPIPVSYGTVFHFALLSKREIADKRGKSGLLRWQAQHYVGGFLGYSSKNRWEKDLVSFVRPPSHQFESICRS